MTTYELVGFRHDYGEYKDKSYDNVYLYCFVNRDEVKGKLEGREVASLKIKTKYLPVGFQPVLGHIYDVLYNQYGYVCRIDDITADIDE